MRSPPSCSPGGDARTVRIEWPMNDHRAMTVRVEGTHEVRQLVAFANESIERTLSKLPRGASVPLLMESLGCRGNAWRVVTLVESGADRTRHSGRDDAEEQRHGAGEEYGQRKERVKV